MNREQIFDIVSDQVDKDVQIVSVLAGEYLIDDPRQMCHSITERIWAVVSGEPQ